MCFKRDELTQLQAQHAPKGVERSQDKDFYSFAPPGSAGGWRVVVLDAYQESPFGWDKRDPRHQRALQTLGSANPRWREDWLKHVEPKNKRFTPLNGALGDEQRLWLQGELRAAADAAERVIILSHVPLHPKACDGATMLWDCDKALEIIAGGRGCVAAVVCGHDHRGGYFEEGGVHHITLKSPLNEEHSSAFGLVDVHPEHLELRGPALDQLLSHELCPRDSASRGGGARRRAASKIVWRQEGHEWLGRRLARRFDHSRIALGTITKWVDVSLDPKDGGPAQWHMVHDDGDDEGLEEHEVIAALGLFATRTTRLLLPLARGPSRVLLMRHGESESNKNPAAHFADPRLTERGRGEASKWRDAARGLGAEVVLVSPLRRAVETAALAFEGVDVPIEICADARELADHGGEHAKAENTPCGLQGLKALLAELPRGERVRGVEAEALSGPPKGNSVGALKDRLRERDEDSVLVVCHYGVIQHLGVSADAKNAQVYACTRCRLTGKLTLTQTHKRRADEEEDEEGGGADDDQEDEDEDEEGGANGEEGGARAAKKQRTGGATVGGKGKGAAAKPAAKPKKGAAGAAAESKSAHLVLQALTTGARAVFKELVSHQLKDPRSPGSPSESRPRATRPSPAPARARHPHPARRRSFHARPRPLAASRCTSCASACAPTSGGPPHLRPATLLRPGAALPSSQRPPRRLLRSVTSEVVLNEHIAEFVSHHHLVRMRSGAGSRLCYYCTLPLETMQQIAAA